MNFLRKLKPKKKDKKPKGNKQIYFGSEFDSFGDMTKDGVMSIEEFYRLMMLLGYPGGKDKAKALWKSRGLPEGGKMSRDEYITMMGDKSVEHKTDSWRKLFEHCDTDGSGFASKEEVVAGLKTLGVKVTPQMMAKVENMDSDRDGKITYAEFLKVQLNL